jgi:2-keto-4-pentenoate hydratase
MSNTAAATLLAQQLIAARQARITLDHLDEAILPHSAAEAYAVQQLTLAALGGAGAYKVGPPLDGPSYAPIPAAKVRLHRQDIVHGEFSRVGLELEIAFRFKAELNATHAQASDAEILDQVAQMMAVVEIVDSRYTKWPQVTKLAQLADLQNNGALIVGEATPYAPEFDFVAPEMSFRCGEQTVLAGPGSNPVGDPRRLLVWLVRKLISEGQSIAPGCVLTTGSYTGCYFAPGPDKEAYEVAGDIAGIGQVIFNLI